MPTPAAPWIATYRLQLHRKFTLADARQVLPYLADLGVSHVYLSPCLQASPGSTHGYDVTDASRISDDLGGESAWSDFVEATQRHRLRILLDIVPNHMAATANNPWWDDVLAHGPFSAYGEFFDIQRDPSEAFRIHLCSLGTPYGDALQAGEITLSLQGLAPRVKHFDSTWPLAASSYGLLLGASDGCFVALERLSQLPDPTPQERREYKEVVAAATTIRKGTSEEDLSAAIAQINQDPDRLDRLLRKQFYALHSWKLAGELTNFRRFFDVSTLVGLSTERLPVFEASHARFKQMIAAGEIDGLRVDHPDGLCLPREYFERLRAMLPTGRIYVEKILDNDEDLQADWPIDGSVGYDFLAKVNRLWMNDQYTDKLTATYADFTGQSVNLAGLVREKKDYIFGYLFAYAHARMSAMALRIAQQSRATRDVSPRQIHDALAQITAALGIYRTYRTATAISMDDKRVLTEAVNSARFSKANIDSSTYDFLLELFTKPSLNKEEAALVLQWQQLTPAVMAKGVEDTTFYCFDRLLSCNEVGAQASLVGISADRFHEYCHYLSEQWPSNQLATSTHDNKRSEDVRTRISLLSEIPDRWAQALHEWSQLNDESWNKRNPDRHAEYLLYQTLVGAWPIDTERCWQYMLKASREAKMRTSWQEPNASHESNIQGFVQRVLTNDAFLKSLEAFIEPLILPGRVNSLAQTLIKLVVPGLPDFYQGTELWDLSLVDPDNRRPVDYQSRTLLLRRARESSVSAVMRDWNSGLPKLWMIDRLLSLRAERPQEFSAESKYQPLVAQGTHLGNLLAFRRGENVIAVVPRLTLSMGNDWSDTVLPLPGGTWVNLFTDATNTGSVTPAAMFAQFPVALLLKRT